VGGGRLVAHTPMRGRKDSLVKYRRIDEGRGPDYQSKIQGRGSTQDGYIVSVDRRLGAGIVRGCAGGERIKPWAIGEARVK